jgi:hypothetical protein
VVSARAWQIDPSLSVSLVPERGKILRFWQMASWKCELAKVLFWQKLFSDYSTKERYWERFREIKKITCLTGIHNIL